MYVMLINEKNNTLSQGSEWEVIYKEEFLKRRRG